MVAPNLERMFRVCNFTVSGDTLRADAISSLVLPDSNNGKISLSLFVSSGGKCKSERREIARASVSFLTRFDDLGYRTYFASRYQSFRAHSIAQLTVLINRVRSAVDVNFSQIDKNARFRACL